MKAVIFSVLILVLGLTSYSFAIDSNEHTKIGLGVDGNPGMFCNIESAEVCVLAASEEDCKKLEGTKVDACPSSQDQE